MSEDVLETVAGAPRLKLRRWPASGAPVLYVHGATFPSALSIGWRFEDGESWAGALLAAGFEAWGLDFAGYGESGRPAALEYDPLAAAPVGAAAEAVQHVAHAVAHIRGVRGGAPVSIIAHSWGTIPAAMFAAASPTAIERLVLFGPILPRAGRADARAPVPAWRLLAVEEQRARFEQDTPRGHGSVLAEPDLARWGAAWLATDAQAHTRTPPAVKVPNGPTADIQALWNGAQLYDPADIEAPSLVVRGEWDSLCTDADAAGFMARSAGRARWDVKLPRGGHLMHLETGRRALWRAVNAFLKEKP